MNEGGLRRVDGVSVRVAEERIAGGAAVVEVCDEERFVVLDFGGLAGRCCVALAGAGFGCGCGWLVLLDFVGGGGMRPYVGPDFLDVVDVNVEACLRHGLLSLSLLLIVPPSPPLAIPLDASCQIVRNVLRAPRHHSRTPFTLASPLME